MVVEERTAAGSDIAEAAHPLDPLSPDEIKAAAALLREKHGLPETARFPLIALAEPDKATVRAFEPGAAIERRAQAILIDRADGKVYEAMVNLSAGGVESYTHRAGVQPHPLFEEFADADQVIRNDPEWQAAMRRRGVTDFDKVQIDPWPAGNFGEDYENEHRILRGISYVLEDPHGNGYGRPVEGVVAVVDVVAKKVIRLIDEGDAPIPAETLRYDLDHVGPIRDDLKPLEITQPESVSFQLRGHELHWQRWRMRISLHPREGLVLHQIGYEDGGRLRPICYRASMSEMVVPYGDPSAGQYFKNAFDSGEVGLGRLTNSLELGCDCLGEIVYMDGWVATDSGDARPIHNAICIHEEDFGILWKHDRRVNDEPASEVRRSRRLVVSSIATIGNYDYGFYWYFYQDGSWEQEVKATGIVQTMAVNDDDPFVTRHPIAKNLAGPIHQHFFSFRLDMEVDGPANSVYEVDTVPLPEGGDNPHNNAFSIQPRLLGREADAQCVVNSASGRFWRITNPTATNALGWAPSYALFPGETVAMMAGEKSAVAKRATFARKQLWVTAYDPAERYPAGDYPAQSRGGDGLPAWTQANRPLDNTDVVLWYTVGLNHIVIPEDWPVAPVHRAGFKLKPWGFFDRNPGIDVAPAEHCAPGEHDHGGHEEHAH